MQLPSAPMGVTVPASAASLHNCTSQVMAVLLSEHVLGRPADVTSALCDVRQYEHLDGDALDDTITDLL